MRTRIERCECDSARSGSTSDVQVLKVRMRLTAAAMAGEWAARQMGQFESGELIESVADTPFSRDARATRCACATSTQEAKVSSRTQARLKSLADAARVVVLTFTGNC